MALNGRFPPVKRTSGRPLRIVLKWSWGRLGVNLALTWVNLGCLRCGWHPSGWFWVRSGPVSDAFGPLLRRMWDPFWGSKWVRSLCFRIAFASCCCRFDMMKFTMTAKGRNSSVVRPMVCQIFNVVFVKCYFKKRICMWPRCRLAGIAGLELHAWFRQPETVSPIKNRRAAVLPSPEGLQ